MQAYNALYNGPKPYPSLAYLARFGLTTMNSLEDRENITLDQFFDGPTLSSITAHLTDPRSGLMLFAGKTAAGKTLLMNAAVNTYLLHEPVSRFIAIDDTGHPEIIVKPENPGAISLSSKGEMASLILSAMRMRPNMVSLGEIRDDETIHHASMMGMTGHQAMATIHANTFADVIKRMGKVDGVTMVIMQERFQSRFGLLALRYSLIITPEIRTVLNDYLADNNETVLYDALEALGAPTLETQKEKMVAAGILASVSSNTILNKTAEHPTDTSTQNGQD